MNYRVTCLTPVLVGDGQKLSPIDYMVWRDQVNVLDQTRIFRLLAKGPRLEGYLTQLRKAEKLDFGSWGGFAQNYAERRVPFDFAGAAAILDKARVESLHIPTFASGQQGPFLPATAIKGALRTALVATRASEDNIRAIASRAQGAERGLRRPGDALEQSALGTGGASRTRAFLAADSKPVSYQGMKIYLVRVATLVQRGQRMEAGWKQGGGTVDSARVHDSTPWFAEMASPGQVFEGEWQEKPFYRQAEIARALHWSKSEGMPALLQAANDWSAHMLQAHKKFAEMAGLGDLAATIDRLGAKVEEARISKNSCVMTIGWGGGLISKTALPDPSSEASRQILAQTPLYTKSLRTGLPFPKTRRIVFEGNRPSSLPGWVLFEVE